jgi:hypothetical protein
MGEAKRKRLAPCRCGSGQPAWQCCLTADGWHKAPSILNLRNTGATDSHESCYLRETNACDTKITREHLISESVLEVLAEKVVAVTGLPGLKGERKVLPFGALVSRCLCSAHNSRLTAIDAAGARFFAAFQTCGTTDNPPGQHFIISGHDLERWLLKTAAALAVSNNFAIDGARMENAVDGAMNVLRLYEDFTAWRPPLGLHAMKGVGYQFTRKDEFQLAPIIRAGNDQLAGIITDIQGFRIGLLTTDHPIKGTGLDKAIYRPGKLVFDLGRVTHSIQLCWEDTLEHITITITWKGPQSGAR